jgi:hypothetical protein
MDEEIEIGDIWETWVGERERREKMGERRRVKRK